MITLHSLENIEKSLLTKIKKVAHSYATLFGGAEGIRTLAPVARSNGLANRPLEPLGYCST